jgi:outer membrane autotransporter protein
VSNDAGSASVVDSVLQLNVQNAANAFASIAGDSLTGLGRIAQLQATQFLDSLSTRLGSGVPGGGGFGMTNDLSQHQHSDDDASTVEGVNADRGMWMRSYGLRGATPGNDNVAAANWGGGGTVVGFDTPVSANSVVGASFDYGSDAVNLDRGGVPSSARIRAPQVATYGSYSWNTAPTTGWQVRGLVAYGAPSISSVRLVTLGGNASLASETHGSQMLSGGTEAEVTEDMGRYQLHGILGLHASNLSESAFSETGSAANLQIAAHDTLSLRSSAGGSIVVPVSFAHASFNFRAAWNHELAATETDLSARLADSTSPDRFTVAGTAFARNSMTIGAGFGGHIRRDLSFYGDYCVEGRGDGQTEHTAVAGLRYVW